MTGIFSLICIILAFAAGYCLGNFRGKKNAETFSNPAVAYAAREKGRDAVQARITKRKARIMERAKREGRITNDDVEDLFCISDSTARNYLNDLERDGKLTQQGATGRGVHYTPTRK